MVLKFFTDPQTGVIVPPVTVFNGGRRSKKTKTKTKTKRNQRKTRTRKQKMSSRKRKTMRK